MTKKKNNKGQPIHFPNGDRAPRGKPSDTLLAYRHVAKTKGPTDERPDTEYETTLRLFKEQSVQQFLKQLDEHEKQQLIKQEARKRETYERIRAMEAKTEEAKDETPAAGTSDVLVEHINRLLGEYVG